MLRARSKHYSCNTEKEDGSTDTGIIIPSGETTVNSCAIVANNETNLTVTWKDHHSRQQQQQHQQHGWRMVRWFFNPSPRFRLLCIMMCCALPFYIIPRLKRPFKDPYLRAKVCNPLQYLQVMYFESNGGSNSQPKRENIKTFVMTNETAFVINLDQDVERMAHFWHGHKDMAGKLTRFSAHEWMPPSTITAIGNATKEKRMIPMLKQQKAWQEQYPFVRRSAKLGRYGDAGCFMSHVLLIQEQLLSLAINNDKDNDYIFVVEDDANFVGALNATHQIQAPGEADVILLTKTATKRIDIPFLEHEPKERNQPETTTTTSSAVSSLFATRVIGGFGGFGYIITRRGAEKLLKHTLLHSKQAMDVSFYEYSSPHFLRVYLPLPNYWPAVRHAVGKSTRLGQNKPDRKSILSLTLGLLGLGGGSATAKVNKKGAPSL